MDSVKNNNTNDSYEIKIGDTVYVVTHNYGTSDLVDVVVDYLAEKTA